MATTLFPGVALVTGAASGIGRGIAIAFAREGCERIVIADHNEAGLEETSRLIKSKHSDTKILVKAVDVRQEERVAFLVQQAVQEFGRIDYAVNAAGILGESGKSHEMSTKAFDDVLAIDYRGCWLCSRQELKQMLSQDPLPTHDGRPGNRGSIVNIASQLGIVSRPTAPAYCSAKAAIIGLTKADAIDSTASARA
ncbi:hypothetical protein LTR66_007120 [Elasticomyces elasticus]|nr:hypothetical protein LTR66_007120 [Elasticomyces elasticus]